MKTKRNLLSITTLLVMVLFWACDSMNDVHEEYIKNGEIIYAPRAYNIEAMPGNGRLKFKMYFINGLNIEKNLIEWNEGKNLIETPTSLNAMLDSLEVVINDLQEKSYIFNVYNLDKDSNRSIKVQVIGTVYGPKYQATLMNRVISSVVKTDNTMVITWASPKEGDNGVKLSYNDANGNPVIYRVQPDELKTNIKSWQAKGTLKYSTYYLPAENALDEFLSSEETRTMP